MKFLKSVVVSGFILAFPLLVGAGDDKQKPTAAAAPVMSKTSYKPPLRGAPAGRVGGGTRGDTARESFSLQVLAPDHVGATIHDQPCLYWFISRGTSYPVELTITERRGVKPLAQKLIKGAENPGIQSFCLTDLGVKLRKNVQYKFFVALLTDTERSKDILAGGILEMIDPPATLPAKLATAETDALPTIYAEEGLWYDALEGVSRLIALSPGSVELHRERALLLEQVGLADAAAFEVKSRSEP
jgi:Domain of Unknown Function (DUF928)